ncbi:DNA double-strand break repair nuclease NurA [Alkalihalobacterium alkalinitrilicum]|uniref:DNA double-strand break repair nuclease NurA n=1 Tax=Alkalihalobacterium alkalinitrilicum TaxID=427920 RepID=UPI0009955417|nr:DNA double-strand break repair nuclease NurA [Alkalihalobacterium alkalinitrilicum]
MLEVSRQLIEKMTKIDKELQLKYGNKQKVNSTIRQSLFDKNGCFRQMELRNFRILSNWIGGLQIAAVDGSVNQTKGEPPHVIYFFQALARTLKGYEKWEFDLYTPLLEVLEEEELETQKRIRSKRMAELELLAAKAMMEDCSLKLILMDGSLTHYAIDAPLLWQEVKQLALHKETLLIGVTEEVGTSFLYQELDLEFKEAQGQQNVYDRDLLFGVLKQGEMLFMEKAQNKPHVHTAWLRPSSDPAVIGVDILIEQKEEMEPICDFLYSTTPKEGRGIPLFLDMVDRDVRISDKLVEALVEQYIQPELKQRLFSPKRMDRLY